jgi:integrase/recombinase XerC
VENEELPPGLSDALDAFAGYLSGERAVSAHTRRAYLGDVRSLLAHAAS